MRYMIVPEPLDVQTPTGPKRYSADVHMREHVQCDPSWRESAERLDALERLNEKIVGRVPGDVIELTDAEHELLLPVWTAKGMQVSPAAAPAFNRLAKALLGASSKDPRPEKPAEP